MIKIYEYFAEVETTEEYNGYFCSVGEALTIVILGSICGLRNVSQIHQWAESKNTAQFLLEKFQIKRIPCYYWLLCLLKLVRPESLNQCFMNWVQSFLPDGVKKQTLSFDGKTIRSTGKMARNKKPLHIISAQIAEIGMTFGQYTTDEKSNEIPAVRELIGLLDLSGCMVVADAMNCQKDTVAAIKKAKADYLLSVKDNQANLAKDIEDYVQDKELRKGMDTHSTMGKQSGRTEKRTAYASVDVDWLYGKEEWEGLSCIGAVHTQFSGRGRETDEWHYYISSSRLSAKELLHHARLEWSVEVMHWLLDVHFSEDYCRVEDRNVQQNLNMVRKIALNSIKDYKERTKSKRAV